MKLQTRNIRALVGLLFVYVLCSGFICTGSQIHKATLAEHDFKTAVQGFQNVEIAEFNSGNIDPATHLQIETWIAQIASGGATLAGLIQKSDAAGALAEVNAINGTIQNLLTQGVLHVKNPKTLAELQVALQAVQAVVTSVQTILG
jgi:hypothetical protein